MGGEGELVSGFDLLGAGGGQRGIGVTLVAEDVSAFCRVCQKLLVQLFRRFLHGGALVPLDFQRLTSLNSGPGIVGEHSDAASS